jgi:non-homologous end joining protein Ku
MQAAVTGKSIKTLTITLDDGVALLVKMYTASTDAKSSTGLGCPSCNCAIKRPAKCSGCGQTEPALGEPVTLYKGSTGAVALTKEELGALPSHDDFIPLARLPLDHEQVKDLIQVAESTYYLIPDNKKGGLSPVFYSNFLEVLKESNQVIIGKYTLRSKAEHLGVLVPDGNVLLLYGAVPFAEQRRAYPQFTVPAPTPTNKQVLTKLVNSISKKFDYSTVEDEYSAALQEYGEKKLATSAVVLGKKPGAKVKKPVLASESVNLMDLLGDSVKARKKVTA